MYRHAALLCLAAALLAAGGCATITTGTSQTITIETSPPGAVCRLTRDNQTLGIVNPTPGSITIGKDKDNIDLTCEQEGFQPTSSSMSPSMEGWTLGNALIGGLIGIAIDAGSGALNEYPASIQVTLIPESFTSLAERDAYFDRMVDDVNTQFDTTSATDNHACAADSCKKRLWQLTKKRDARIAEIENFRATAQVVPVSCAAANC